MSENYSSITDKDFAHAMKGLRELRGYSQNQFASALNKAGLNDFYQTTVSRIEKGDRAVRLNEALIIARVLGTSVDAMLTPDEVSKKVTDVYRELASLQLYRGEFEKHIDSLEIFRLQAIMALEKINALTDIDRSTSDVDTLLESLANDNEDGNMTKLLTESAYDIVTNNLKIWTATDSEESVRKILEGHTQRAEKVIQDLDLAWEDEA